MKKILNKRTQNLQKAFNDKKLIYGIVQNSRDAVGLRLNFAEIFQLYFANKNGKPLDERYYFQAFNGVYEETFKKNGLGNISGLNITIIQAFKLLEDELGKTTFALGGNNNNTNSNFLTTDPFMLMKFALMYSPERLWLGPLGVDVVDGIKFPYKIGETKCQYMMRLLESKIPENIDNEKRKKIIEAGEIICNEFGSKRPRIAIIPESEIKDYPADFAGNYEYCQTKLFELADMENAYWTYNMQSGPNFSSSQGVCVYGNITPDKFTTITIPDIFELIQICAIEKGANLGDLVDPQNGDIIQKSNEVNTLLPIQIKKPNLKDKLFQIIGIVNRTDESRKTQYQECEKPKLEERKINNENKQSLTELSKQSEKILSQVNSNTDLKKEDSKFKGEIK